MRSLLAAIGLAGLASPTLASTVAPMPPIGSNRPLNDQQLLLIYQNKLKPLRAEILARQTSEGGRLSAESHIEFQARLDRLNSEFRRFVRKQDVYGYDAWGYRVVRDSPAKMNSRP